MFWQYEKFFQKTLLNLKNITKTALKRFFISTIKFGAIDLPKSSKIEYSNEY